MIFNFKNNQKGFTLIEILIAISIFSIGIVGIYSLLNTVISTNYVSSDRFIASRLAQEGLEIVVNNRDRNWLKQTEWDDDLNDGDYLASYDDIDLLTYEDSFLKIDANGCYNYDNGADTKYKRKITLSHPDPDSLNIRVEVSWPDDSSPLIVEKNLYNWK
jgi:prepilin-type N-terminal cleavage/methylation domain-containing protein